MLGIFQALLYLILWAIAPFGKGQDFAKVASSSKPQVNSCCQRVHRDPVSLSKLLLPWVRLRSRPTPLLCCSYLCTCFPSHWSRGENTESHKTAFSCFQKRVILRWPKYITWASFPLQKSRRDRELDTYVSGCACDVFQGYQSFLFSGGACPSPLHAATKRCTRILQQISNSLHVTHHTHDAHPAGPGSVWNSCYPSALPSTSFSWPPGSALASLPSLPGYFTGSSLSLQISRFDFPPPELLCITSGLRDLIIYSQTVWRFHL